ncbi:MAG: hypothetical protein A2Y12_05655 [Planctomycetes bacterium GWF2_42_9]|nr:MAG: hypothetical protein A2Y12_05655 [Planctomycetes bacterium GWF2_42_9]
MNRKERLTATLLGKQVDRSAVSFYELNGIDEDPYDDSPFNIYSHPSWKSLINLTREKTDRIVMRNVPYSMGPHIKIPYWSHLKDIGRTDVSFDNNGSRFMTLTLQTGCRTLTSRTRQDRDVNTVWTLEYLLKDVNDIRAWLEMPVFEYSDGIDLSYITETERLLADSGIVMIDTPDPVCCAVELLGFETMMLMATLESKLFHQLLQRFASVLHHQTDYISQALPGRLWRIYGPEAMTAPYFRPKHFREYIVKYDAPMIHAIERNGGYARIHCHGKVKDILDDIVSMGCSGIDPLEPPPQGDVDLWYVRQKYGEQLVLFGNLEIADIENMPTLEFEKRIINAIKQGTCGKGRGFVLMPSACPYGRVVSDLTLRNYETIIEIAESYSGN